MQDNFNGGHIVDWNNSFIIKSNSLQLYINFSIITSSPHVNPNPYKGGDISPKQLIVLKQKFQNCMYRCVTGGFGRLAHLGKNSEAPKKSKFQLHPRQKLYKEKSYIFE